MRKGFLTLFFLLQLSASHAQTGWQWGISGIGSEALVIAPDNRGNVYAAAEGALVFGFTMGKVDNTGSILWTKTVNDAILVGMATDPSANLYVLALCGSSFSIDTFTDHPILSPGLMYVLIKCSPAGVVQSVKNITYNNTTGIPDYAFGGIGIDGAGNVYVAGAFNPLTENIGPFVLYNRSTLGHFDDFLAKYDTSGNVIWAQDMGGVNNDFVYTLSASRQGDVYISGVYESDTLAIGVTYLYNPLVLDMTFLARYDSSGTLLWAKNMGDKIVINGLKADQYGNICMVGGLTDPVIIGPDTLACHGSSNLLVAKYDSSGNPIWGVSSGGIMDDKGYGVDVDACGNVWVSGVMAGSGLAVGASYTMNFQGHPLSTPTGSYDPMFIAEYNNTGAFITAKALVSGGDDQSGIAVDNRGNAYVCGDYESATITFGTDILSTTPGNETLFIGKYFYATDTINKMDTTLCTPLLGDPVTFSPPVGLVSYTWSTGSDTSISIAANGVYWLSGISSCNIVTDSFAVTIVQQDSSIHSADTMVCAPDDSYFTVVLTAPTGSNYTWFDGSAGNTDSVNTHGVYWVGYMVNCTYHIDTFHVNFAVSSPPCYTGINTVATVKNEIEIYPNPAFDEITIHSNSPFTPGSIAGLYDLTGRLVSTFPLSGNSTVFSVTGLSSGMYQCKISTGENIIVKKIAVMK